MKDAISRFAHEHIVVDGLPRGGEDGLVGGVAERGGRVVVPIEGITLGRIEIRNVDASVVLYHRGIETTHGEPSILQLPHAIDLLVGIKCKHLFQLIGGIEAVGLGCDISQFFFDEQFARGTIDTDRGFCHVVSHLDFGGGECHDVFCSRLADANDLFRKSSDHQASLHLVLIAHIFCDAQRTVVEKAHPYGEVIPMGQQSVRGQFVTGSAALRLVFFHGLSQTIDGIWHSRVVLHRDGIKYRLCLFDGRLQTSLHLVRGGALLQQLTGFVYLIRQCCPHLLCHCFMSDSQHRHQRWVFVADSHVAVVAHVAHRASHARGRQSHSQDKARAIGVEHLPLDHVAEP